MKKLTVILGLVLVMCLLVPVSCAPPSELPVNSVYIPIDEFKSHPHIDVVMHGRAGGGLTVALGSNPTTGFQWSEFAEVSDETIIQQISHMYVGKDYETPPPPGTSGEEVWIFKALQRGTTTIYLEYSRPWVEEEIGYWTVTITVNIR